MYVRVHVFLLHLQKAAETMQRLQLEQQENQIEEQRLRRQQVETAPGTQGSRGQGTRAKSASAPGLRRVFNKHERVTPAVGPGGRGAPDGRVVKIVNNQDQSIQVSVVKGFSNDLPSNYNVDACIALQV